MLDPLSGTGLLDPPTHHRDNMIIQDLFVIPSRGLIILLHESDPGLEGVMVGSKLQQGANIWEVTGVEMGLRTLRTSHPQRTIGLLLKPISPVPERGGEITKV